MFPERPGTDRPEPTPSTPDRADVREDDSVCSGGAVEPPRGEGGAGDGRASDDATARHAEGVR